MTYEEITDKLRSTDWYMCHEVPSVASNNAADALSFIEEQAARIAETEKEYHEERKARYAAQSQLVASQARLSEAVKVLKAVSDTSHRARDREHYKFPLATMELVDAFIATLWEEK